MYNYDMNEKLLEKCTTVKSLLDSDSNFMGLNRVNDLINESVEVAFLSFTMNNIFAELEYNQEKKSSAKTISDIRKRYSEAKRNLYAHPLVVEYHAHYKNVREIMDYLNRTLFGYILVEAKTCG